MLAASTAHCVAPLYGVWGQYYTLCYPADLCLGPVLHTVWPRCTVSGASTAHCVAPLYGVWGQYCALCGPAVRCLGPVLHSVWPRCTVSGASTAFCVAPPYGVWDQYCALCGLLYGEATVIGHTSVGSWGPGPTYRDSSSIGERANISDRSDISAKNGNTSISVHIGARLARV